MDAAVSELLGRAFHRCDARDANQEMADLRASRGGEVADALSYEAVLPDPASIGYLADRVLPRLVYFLDCRGERLPRADRVFVSLFVGQTLYFVAVPDFLEVLSRSTGMSVDEMVKKYGAASVP